MGFGRGALLWLLGIPLSIIICLPFLCITDRVSKVSGGCRQAAPELFWSLAPLSARGKPRLYRE